MTDTPATGPGGRTPGPTHAAATRSNPAGTLLPLGAGRGRLTVGSLFSGIGGLDLGLERAGMTVRWQSEIDPYACRVLAKHWPQVPNLGDITTIDWSQVEPVDLICGGYPCQPFSLAGVRRGESDPRHLWPHFHRAIRHLRPRYALLENVPGHRSLGFDRVLGDLAAIGYDVEWCSLPAAAVGAPHLRWRLFAVAYPHSQGKPELAVDAQPRPRIMVPDTHRRRHGRTQDGGGVGRLDGRDEGAARQRERTRPLTEHRSATVAHASVVAKRESTNEADTVAGSGDPRAVAGGGGWWAVEPDVGRVAHGVPSRVDRLRCLGNAVVPQVAEWIGHRILEAAA